MKKELKFNCQVDLAKHLQDKNIFYNHLDEEERKKIVDRRIKNFYSVSQEIDLKQENFRPRIDPSYDQNTTTTPDTVILYGTDFLNPLQLKQMFAVVGSAFRYVYIDASNCMVKFDSPETAKEAVMANVKKNSQTVFKLEEGESWWGWNQGQKGEIPKGWIQFDDYTYRHVYKNQNPSVYKQFNRKLLARFATSKQKFMGKLSTNHLEQLYEKSKQIWNCEAEKDMQLKEVVREQLRRFKEKNEQVKNMRRNRGRQDQSIIMRAEDCSRSRSRSRDREKRKKANLDVSIIGTGEENDEIVRKEAAEMENLVHFIQKINISCEEQQKAPSTSSASSASHSLIQQLQNLNFDHYRPRIVDLPYKLTTPNQIRVNKNKIEKEKFRYEEYVKKDLDEEGRFKNFMYVDLTD